jgi:hypothetical protein
LFTDREIGIGVTYFFSSLSFLGWHFSQTLPSLAALTQHLWSHFFPASTVASQQAAKRPLEQKAKATTANTSDFTNFMFSFPGWPTVGQHSVFLNSAAHQSDSASTAWNSITTDYNQTHGLGNNDLAAKIPLHPAMAGGLFHRQPSGGNSHLKQK